MLTAGLISATSNISSAANVSGGNLLTAGLISATSNISSAANISGGNVLTGGQVSATGNITSAANISGGNVLTGGQVSATGNITSAANIAGGNVSASGNIRATGTVSASGNVTGTAITAASGNISSFGGFYYGCVSVTLASTGNTGNVNLLAIGNGNVNITSPGTGITLISSNIASVTGNVQAGNVRTAGLISATGNVTGGNILSTGAISTSGTATAASTVGGVITGTSVSVTGGVTAASVAGGVITGTSASVTGGVTAASVAGGVMTGTSVSVTGTATAASTVGGVITGTSTSVTGNITGGNVLTGGQVSATGNVTGANLVVSTNIYDASTMTLVTGAGDVQLQPAGNVALGNRYITGVRTPAVADDAVNKQYVDNAVSTSISYHQAVLAATNTTLAVATGGTVTYNQPNGVGNGQGAYLQTTGAFTLIDTANVQTVGTRILVKNEANAVFNGVYVWSNATVITRSSDTNTYGAGNASALSINDYFFVQSGNVNEGSAYIVDSPVGTITFGSSNITFAQFSQSQIYEANTSAGLSLVGTTFSAKVDNNTTAFDGNGNISVKAGANLTTPNIGSATGTSLSVTGGVTAASVAGGAITGTSVSVTGTATAASTVGGVITGSTASLTGNVTSGNLLTGGDISGTGNITGGNIFISGLLSATGNITSAANVSVGNLLVTGNIVDSGALTIITGADGNIALVPNGTGQVTVSTALSVVGNVTAANVNGVGVFKNGITVLNADDIIDGGTY